MDKSQCRRSSEYYASSIYEDDILSRGPLAAIVAVLTAIATLTAVTECIQPIVWLEGHQLLVNRQLVPPFISFLCSYCTFCLTVIPHN